MGLMSYPTYISGNPRKNIDLPKMDLKMVLLAIGGLGVAYFFWQQQKKARPAIVIPERPGVTPTAPAAPAVPATPAYKGVNWLDITSGAGSKFAEGISTWFKPAAPIAPIAPTAPTAPTAKKVKRVKVTVNKTDFDIVLNYTDGTSASWGKYYTVGTVVDLIKNKSADYDVFKGNATEMEYRAVIIKIAKYIEK